jgi:hypothetical protein
MKKYSWFIMPASNSGRTTKIPFDGISSIRLPFSIFGSIPHSSPYTTRNFPLKSEGIRKVSGVVLPYQNKKRYVAGNHNRIGTTVVTIFVNKRFLEIKTKIVPIRKIGSPKMIR